jgi:DNA-binding response OmpR family regulator
MKANYVILIVEDNKKLCEINRRVLEKEGYSIKTALTIEDARKYMDSIKFDLILLDILMPDGNGINFCNEIRSETDAHIIFLTSSSEHSDKISAFDLGGDDYITKPYRLDELVSRVKAVFRRRDMMNKEKSSPIIEIGPIMLNTVTSDVFISGHHLVLTQKEFAILYLLIKNKGKVLSKEYIYETVWKQKINNDSNALWTQISRLNKKLDSVSDGKITILSLRKKGYNIEIQI